MPNGYYDYNDEDVYKLLNRDVMHKISNAVIAYAITNEIDTIAIGHNNGWKQSVDSL